MQLCFVDEAGDLGSLGNLPQPNDQPVLVVGGLFVDAARLAKLTDDFLDLKHRFFPNLPYPSSKQLDRILPEIKGADLRRNATRGNGKQRRHAVGFVDRIIGLLRGHDVRLVARIWIKALGDPFEGTAVYTSSIQALRTYFEHYLAQSDSEGLCIADSRNKGKNLRVSHSIFTQKFGVVPKYERLVELPTFGHSDNHAGLQLCDIVCSALLYSHLARLIYADAVSWKPMDLAQLREYVDMNRKSHHVDGALGEYIMPNSTIFDREGMLYADIAAYEEERASWSDPADLIRPLSFSGHPPTALRLAESMSRLGMFTQRGVELTAEVWGSVEFKERESFREANALTRNLLEGLIAEDLPAEEAEDEDVEMLYQVWQLPMYHFDFGLIEVPLEDLHCEQEALLRAEIGADYY